MDVSLTNQFADKMTRSQQRQQVHSPGELSVNRLVSEQVRRRNQTCSYYTAQVTLFFESLTIT